jgi:hypothetical protein
MYKGTYQFQNLKFSIAGFNIKIEKFYKLYWLMQYHTSPIYYHYRDAN